MRFTQSLDRLPTPNGLTNDAEVLEIAHCAAVSEGIVLGLPRTRRQGKHRAPEFDTAAALMRIQFGTGNGRHRAAGVAK